MPQDEGRELADHGARILAIEREIASIRGLAQNAAAGLMRIEAVAVETEKRRQDFQANMEAGLANIQRSWERGATDLSERHSRAVNTIAESLSKTNQALMDRMDGLTKMTTTHMDQDTQLFSGLGAQIGAVSVSVGKSQSFLTGGWKFAAIGGTVLYAVVQTGLAIVAIYK